MNEHRRLFLKGALAGGAYIALAPAIVQAKNLMPIKEVDSGLIWHDEFSIVTFRFKDVLGVPTIEDMPKEPLYLHLNMKPKADINRYFNDKELHTCVEKFGEIWGPDAILESPGFNIKVDSRILEFPETKDLQHILNFTKHRLIL